MRSMSRASKNKQSRMTQAVDFNDHKYNPSVSTRNVRTRGLPKPSKSSQKQRISAGEDTVIANRLRKRDASSVTKPDSDPKARRLTRSMKTLRDKKSRIANLSAPSQGKIQRKRDAKSHEKDMTSEYESD